MQIHYLGYNIRIMTRCNGDVSLHVHSDLKHVSSVELWITFKALKVLQILKSRVGNSFDETEVNVIIGGRWKDIPFANENIPLNLRE